MSLNGIRRGTRQKMRLGSTQSLGMNFSGVVEEVGADTEGFKKGDAVYGLNSCFSDGAAAEYCLAAPDQIAPKPETIDHVQALGASRQSCSPSVDLMSRRPDHAGYRKIFQRVSDLLWLDSYYILRDSCHLSTRIP